MNVASYLILALVLGAFVWALHRSWRRRKSPCSGCTPGCGGCEGCGHTRK